MISIVLGIMLVALAVMIILSIHMARAEQVAFKKQHYIYQLVPVGTGSGEVDAIRMDNMINAADGSDTEIRIGTDKLYSDKPLNIKQK